MHLRHRRLRAHEHRRPADPQRARPRHDGRVAHRRQDDLRARGQRLHRGGGRAVAPRRARASSRAPRTSRRSRARSPSSDGVVFVPALAGLGAPHWDQDARGTITGLTRGTTAAHLARATLEGIAFEVRDLLDAMAQDAKRPLRRLRVDGGAAANDLLMQFQADVADVVVERPADLESTGRGAAMLAGIGAGLFAGSGRASRRCRRWRVAVRAAHGAADRAAHLSRWERRPRAGRRLDEGSRRSAFQAPRPGVRF